MSGRINADLKAAWPWFGGKSKVAQLVWDRLGNVDNFVEPFAGSLAILLKRPPEHFKVGYRVETCNDLNHYLVNAWRAIAAAPGDVAKFADWPVNEADLHARHTWLMRSSEVAEWRERMRVDPMAFDARIAGWWIWGACCWIGSGWCSEANEPATQIDDLGGGFGEGRGVVNKSGSTQARRLSAAGQGINKTAPAQIVDLSGGGVGVQGRPQLTDAFDIGRGVNASAAALQRPQITSSFDIGEGVNFRGNLPSRQLPDMDGCRGENAPAPVHLSTQMPEIGGGTYGASQRGVHSVPAATFGTCAARRAWLTDWMQRLSDRLRLVRTCYGHWSRVCDSDSTLTRLGTTGVFLDSPYCLSVERMHEWVTHLRGDGPIPKSRKGKAERSETLYASDAGSDLDRLVAEVHIWGHKWGANKDIRICIAGYEGEHNPLEELGWDKVEWKTAGGYANQNKDKKKNENAGRERLWFNPSCLKTNELSLFDEPQ